MFDFNVEVLAAFRAEELGAAVVRADVGSVNLASCSSHVFLPTVLVLLLELFFVSCLLLLELQHLFHLGFHLSLFGLFNQLLLLLLLSQSVQELVRLSEDLGNQGVFVKVLDVEDFARHFVVLGSRLVNVTNQVLVLEEEPPEFFVIINLGVVLWWSFHEHISDFGW